MKKLLSVILSIALVASALIIFAGCNKEPVEKPDDGTTDVSENTSDETTKNDETTAADETEPPVDEDDYEFNPRLDRAWRKDDTTVVFEFDGYVSVANKDADIKQNIYIANTADGEPIASPKSFLSYNGDLSKTYELVFDGTLPAAGAFYLVIKETAGDGNPDLNTAFIDYASAGVYGNTKKGSEYVATVQVTDEEIEATKSLIMEWCKLVGQNVVAVKYNDIVTVDAMKVNDFGHVAHMAPLNNGQLVTFPPDDVFEKFPGAISDIIQRHTRYFISYDKDPSIVLFIFSTEYYGTNSGCIDDSFQLDCQAWYDGVQELGEGWTIILREFPNECITSAESGKTYNGSRDVPITDADFDLVDLTGIVGALPGVK